MNIKKIKLIRTFQEGLDNFRRNGWLSFATVSVLAISLYIISFTVILGITANMVLKNIQDKINVSVYFNSDVEESYILEMKDKIVGYPEIKSVDYVSKDQALDNFRKLGDNNQSINQALEELGENPLLASLVIKANLPEQYEIISKSIGGSVFAENISRIDFEDNKKAISRLTSIINMVEKTGLVLGIIFVFIGILITFNAIRLTMYAHKQEFEIMRLVGASNLYIRMPFIFEGIFYGVASAIIVFAALLITAKFMAPLTEGSINGGDIFSFCFSNSFIILPALLLFGILLGTVSGFIAIRRYLKI
ncbi:MAG TPA: permease-like cell division protein FtsX [Candidatus Moranbacteria bacterium]|nr:permease-like cell division protein FtsX [Candidatus Moranbacteria bacterium]